MSGFPKQKPPHNMRVLQNWIREYADQQENARVHDLMDLLLARDLLAPEDLRRVREACTAIFDHRQKQVWPPQLTVYRSWAETYARLADEESFPVGDIAEAASLVEEFIAEIDATSLSRSDVEKPHPAPLTM
jgi:hypothetical protein